MSGCISESVGWGRNLLSTPLKLFSFFSPQKNDYYFFDTVFFLFVNEAAGPAGDSNPRPVSRDRNEQRRSATTTSAKNECRKDPN